MPSGIIASLIRASLLAGLVLAGAGCNLVFAPPGAATRFEGPPQIVIAAPLPNQTFLAGTTVIVQARVENAGADLTRISVLLDEALLGEKINPNETGAAILPLSIDWPTSNPGNYQVAVTAERGDGTSARADVMIRVIAQGESQPPEPDSAETASDTDGAAGDASTNALDHPHVTATLIQSSELRRGPSADHDIIGSLDIDAPIVIVAVSPYRDWYRIQDEDKEQVWLLAESVVEVDISGLPAETGPPPPLPNLVVEDLRLQPDAPVCGEEIAVSATIRNTGSHRAPTLGLPIIEALRSDSGKVVISEPITLMQGLDADESYQLNAALTLREPLGTDLVIRVTVGGIQVAEIDASDNSATSQPFSLAAGDCG
ncbi:MAG: Ig-like domain-containing protein [Chloroflexi bacterium]|nr:Ig-like domain-containing protein [Chloroflexota bacterium]